MLVLHLSARQFSCLEGYFNVSEIGKLVNL